MTRSFKCASCGAVNPKLLEILKCDLCLTSFDLTEETKTQFFHLPPSEDYCPPCMAKIIDEYKRGIEIRRKMVGAK